MVFGNYIKVGGKYFTPAIAAAADQEGLFDERMASIRRMAQQQDLKFSPQKVEGVTAEGVGKVDTQDQCWSSDDDNVDSRAHRRPGILYHWILLEATTRAYHFAVFVGRCCFAFMPCQSGACCVYPP